MSSEQFRLPVLDEIRTLCNDLRGIVTKEDVEEHLKSHFMNLYGLPYTSSGLPDFNDDRVVRLIRELVSILEDYDIPVIYNDVEAECDDCKWRSEKLNLSFNSITHTLKDSRLIDECKYHHATRGNPFKHNRFTFSMYGERIGFAAISSRAVSGIVEK